MGHTTASEQWDRRITVVEGIGQGRTTLSSFDAALVECGAANYNLLCLSSVIPPGTEVTPAHRYCPNGDEHGDRLYVVKADARSDCQGAYVGAAIGWYQWGDGRGVFVEHEVVTRSEGEAKQTLHDLVFDSMHDLCKHRDVDYDPSGVGMRCAVAPVGAHSTCALVLAIYAARSWDR